MPDHTPWRHHPILGESPAIVLKRFHQEVAVQKAWLDERAANISFRESSTAERSAFFCLRNTNRHSLLWERGFLQIMTFRLIQNEESTFGETWCRVSFLQFSGGRKAPTKVCAKAFLQSNLNQVNLQWWHAVRGQTWLISNRNVLAWVQRWIRQNLKGKKEKEKVSERGIYVHQ